MLLAGASGLVGTRVLAELTALDAPALRVVAPVRRTLAARDPRVHVVAHALEDASADDALTAKLREAFDGRAPGSYVCCLGTTIAVAGSRERFAAVDLGLVLRLARIARALGARQAIAITSVGAHPRSRNFYLHVKGEAEAGLAATGFERVDLLRPGLLLGARRESRPAEAFMRATAPVWNPLLRGPLRRYRAIAADTVARAIAALVGADEPGVYVHENDEQIRRASFS
ncbi:MAG TPA: oxidoreductase [Xanthomonadales bacterium]|nr:oxidoreductase [Xanthomonadales bacterium]